MMHLYRTACGGKVRGVGEMKPTAVESAGRNASERGFMATHLQRVRWPRRPRGNWRHWLAGVFSLTVKKTVLVAQVCLGGICL